MMETPESGEVEHRRRPLLKWIFVSAEEPRLRAGWRLLLQIVLQFVVLLLVSVLLLTLLPGMLTGTLESLGAPELIGSLIAELISVTLSIYVVRRLLDHRSFASLGLQLRAGAARQFAAGIGITFLMMGVVFVLQWLLGWLKVDGFAWSTQRPGQVMGAAIFFLVVCLLVAWNEELMSRGYHLQTLGSGLTLTWGWILSSAVFGALHLANPHASLVAAAGIVLAGLLLGYAYLRTGQLWLSMGLHTGWNFFEGVVFGFPVSGLPFYHLTLISVNGPVIWTGGEFGPEAGLILLPAILLGFGLTYLMTRRGGAA
jgi:membrane protease YdiL (CAAX protease family)